MAEHHSEIDWQAVERSPEFRELIRRKKAFVLPATLFFMTWYFGFIVLAGYAPDFMGREFIADGLTVGYVLALSQFVMTWVLGWMYARRAGREFDPLAERAREAGVEAVPQAVPHADRPSRRFRKGTIVDEPAIRSATTEEVSRR